MTKTIRTSWTLAFALALTASQTMAQVTVLNGKSTIGSDSNAGRLLTVISVNSGGVRVSIRTEPAVALVCDEKTPVTRCAAWVKADERIALSLRRPESPRTPPGQGAAPTAAEWGLRGCPGTISGGDCIVTMSGNRTVSVDWAN